MFHIAEMLVFGNRPFRQFIDRGRGVAFRRPPFVDGTAAAGNGFRPGPG
jgi:hypothetical protein